MYGHDADQASAIVLEAELRVNFALLHVTFSGQDAGQLDFERHEGHLLVRFQVCRSVTLL